MRGPSNVVSRPCTDAAAGLYAQALLACTEGGRGDGDSNGGRRCTNLEFGDKSENSGRDPSRTVITALMFANTVAFLHPDRHSRRRTNAGRRTCSMTVQIANPNRKPWKRSQTASRRILSRFRFFGSLHSSCTRVSQRLTVQDEYRQGLISS